MNKMTKKTIGFPLKETLDCDTDLVKFVKLASHEDKFASIKADHLKETFVVKTTDSHMSECISGLVELGQSHSSRHPVSIAAAQVGCQVCQLFRCP